MILIVGLGNPGKEYDNTRHNIGFDVIDKYLSNKNISIDKEKYKGIYTITTINNQKVIFLKPQKYMNLSGEVVKQIVDFYKIKTENILVIHDDLDLPIGKIKLKENSSSGGHNGIKNIELHLGTKNYKRLKIGISNDKKIDTKKYVLKKLQTEEKKLLENSINEACNVIDDYFNYDFNTLMNKYNKKS